MKSSTFPVAGLPVLHATPLPSVVCEPPAVFVEVDDEQEKRFTIEFTPFQAMKMTTADCFCPPEGVSIVPQVILEVQESKWIDELTRVLSSTDRDADFMNKARHFLVPLQDDFLEVIAWGVRIVDRE